MTCIPMSRKIFGGDYFVSLMKLSMGFQCLIIGFVLDLSRGRQNCVYLTTFIDRARGQKKKKYIYWDYSAPSKAKYCTL